MAKKYIHNLLVVAANCNYKFAHKFMFKKRIEHTTGVNQIYWHNQIQKK